MLVAKLGLADLLVKTEEHELDVMSQFRTHKFDFETMNV